MVPYLTPKIANNKKYTLVLDLDETLIHYVENLSETSSIITESVVGTFLIRPGAH